MRNLGRDGFSYKGFPQPGAAHQPKPPPGRCSYLPVVPTDEMSAASPPPPG
jgi:hypothetical protein